MMNAQEGYISQSNGLIYRFRINNKLEIDEEKAIVDTSKHIFRLDLVIFWQILEASFRDLIWFTSKNFGFFYNFTEKVTYILDNMSTFKPVYEGDLRGYFSKTMKKDQSEEHLFLQTGKAEITI